MSKAREYLINHWREYKRILEDVNKFKEKDIQKLFPQEIVSEKEWFIYDELYLFLIENKFVDYGYHITTKGIKCLSNTCIKCEFRYKCFWLK